MAAGRILTSIICGAIMLGAHPALASPRTDPTAGRAVFTGATLPHATSVTVNPAALGLGVANELYVALTGALQQITIDRKALDVATGALTDGPTINDTQLGPGGMVAIVWHPSDRLALGFGAHLPPPEMHPEGHDPLRYHTLGVGQRSYLATIGVSLRVTNAFYFGASVSHDNTFLKLRYARDKALEAGTGPGGIFSDCGGMACGVENPEATELYDVDVRSPYIGTQNLKVNVGTVFRIYPDVWVGIAYHTPPGLDIESSFDGTMEVTRAPREGGEVIRGGGTVTVSLPASLDGEVRARLPRDLELHVGARWEDLSRMQAYDVRGFGSTFRTAGIPEWTVRARGMEDSLAIWTGVEQIDTGGPYRLGARIGIETGAVSEERTAPMTIAPTFLSLDLGGQVRLSPTWMVQLSYGIQLAPGVSVERSAFDPRYRLDCIASDFDYSTRACEAVRNGYALPTAAGEYWRLDHALRLGFRYELP